MILKIRSQRLGNHMHQVFFLGEVEGSLANLGKLTFTIDEWDRFREVLGAGAAQYKKSFFEIILEGETEPWSEPAERRKVPEELERGGRRVRP